MNVFLQELKMLRVSTTMWILVLVSIVLIYTALYPAFSSDAVATEKIFESLPLAIKEALKIDVHTMLSFLGFFAFTFTELTLFAGIHAMQIGVSIASREQRSKTTDFLLTKPSSRTSIFVQKYVAGLCIVIVTWVFVTVTSFGFARAFGAGDFSLSSFGLLMLALLIIQLWFFACGVFSVQILRRVKSTLPITLAVTFGFFMVGMLGAILGDLQLRYISPFRFFDYVDIASGKGVELVYVVIAAGSFVAMFVMSYFMYLRRDIKAVV